MQNDRLTIQGDLSQIGTQIRVLKNLGIKFDQTGVSPIVTIGYEESALRLLYRNSINGWWHYCDNYMYYNICTKSEFMKQLKYKQRVV